MAKRTFGGRITLQFAGFPLSQCEAEITLDPAEFEKSAMANQDGSPCYTLKPKLPSVEIKPRDDTDINWSAMMLARGNLTIVEETNGRTHFLTDTELTGTPKIGLSTGEVDGLKAEGGRYRSREG